MPWTLAELSKVETDVLRKSVIDTLVMETNILELLPFETIGQLSTGIVRIQDLPSVAFRRINLGYPESTGTFEHKVEQIALLGGDIDTDKAIARAKNTIADARAIQQQMMLKRIAYVFNDCFINGDRSVIYPVVTQGELGDARKVGGGAEFNGLNVRVIEADTETEKQIVDASAVKPLKDATNQHKFLDALDELIYSIAGHQPAFLLMHHKSLLLVRSVLRRLGLLDTTKDMFDRRVDTYQGARLVDIGAVPEDDGTWRDIIPFPHDTLYTDIYAVKFGVGDMTWGIAEYPLEVEDLGELETKPVYRTRVDFPCGLATVDPRSVGKMTYDCVSTT